MPDKQTTGWSRFIPGFLRRRIESNQQLQGILGNSGWLLGDKVVRKALGFLIGVLLARHFGPELFGQYSYAVALVWIVTPIANLPPNPVSVRRFVQQSADSNYIFGTSFALMASGGICAFIAAMTTVFLASPGDPLVHWLVGILAVGTIFQAFWIIDLWFFSQVRSKYSVYAKTSAFVAASVVKLVLIFSNASLIAIALTSLAEIALASAGLIYLYQRKGHTIRTWQFSRETAKSMLQESWPLILAAFLTMVYLRIDQIMLGNISGNQELGKYALAVQFSEVWNFLPLVICGSVFPAILEAETFSEELFYSRLQRLYGLVAFLTYLFAIPMTFFADDLIGLLFDQAYSGAGPLLSILVWTGLFISLGTARNSLVVAKRWTRVNLITIALGCAANIILNLLLIPKYGAMGAVFATLVSYWFTIHGSCFLFKPLRETGWMMTKAMLYPKFW